MRYAAFISYSHRDRTIADWVHRRLETYRVPAPLRGRAGALGEIGARLPPVFKDREELASSADLAESVRAALAEASSLVVICSPDAARSRWVNEEIRTFRALGRGDRIQCIIVRGHPYASRLPGADPAEECFPPALFEGGAADPLAADGRAEGDGKRVATLKLIAGILGVGYAELRDREARRAHRRLALIATASLAGFVLMSAVALFAIGQRRQAIAERDIARQKTMTAERTVDFVESMFQVANPSEAKGTTITAREVLDRGARRIDSSLNDEPLVKTELTATLSEVYGALGLYRQSDALIRRSFAIPGRSAELEARQLMLLGESQVRLAAYDAAARTFDRALALTSAPGFRRRDMGPRILASLSEAQAKNGQADAAERSAAAAVRLSEAPGTALAIRATALEALGYAYFLNDKIDRAEPYYTRAIALRLPSQGRLHPRVTENLNTLGNIAYLRRQPAVAERYYRSVLANDQTVLGPDHPDVALTLNSLGRVLLEQRKFLPARDALTRSVAISARERNATDEAFTFVLDNLGLVERALGRPAAAEALFRRAVAVTTALRHRNRAPTMTDLADALCAQGKFGEALGLLDRARPLMVGTYPDDPWRAAWTDNVRGDCLMRSGRAREGAALVLASSRPLRERWAAHSLYGEIVARRVERARRIG